MKAVSRVIEVYMTLQILQSSIKKAKKNKDKTKIEFFQKLEVVDLQLAKDKKRVLGRFNSNRTNVSRLVITEETAYNDSIQNKDNRNRKKEIMVMNHHPSSNEFAETP